MRKMGGERERENVGVAAVAIFTVILGLDR